MGTQSKEEEMRMSMEKEKKQRKLPEVRQSQENLYSYLYSDRGPGCGVQVNPLLGGPGGEGVPGHPLHVPQSYSELVLRNISHQQNLEQGDLRYISHLPDVVRNDRSVGFNWR